MWFPSLPMGSRQHRVIFNLSHIGKALQSVHVFDLLYRAFIQNTALYEFLRQHRTIAEASAVESPIRQETIGFPAHFFARAHNFKPPGRACQPEADSPMRT